MTRPDEGGEPRLWWDTGELDSFDSTLANLAEIVFACLDAAGARSVVEVGAEYGLFTKELLEWGARVGAERIVAVDPAPDRRLTELAEARPELELIVATSHEALAELEPADAVIVDGDHNYFTVRGELRLIAEQAAGRPLPLILLHDVGWPLGRRDSYHALERIPEASRQPVAEKAFIVPEEPGVAERGLLYDCVAAREGGPANGVLTAVEDFVAAGPDVELALAAPFFGLAVIWDRRAPWAGAVSEALAPFDRNPLLERLERKRIDHLVAEFQNLQRIDDLRSADYELRYEVVTKLLPMTESSAISIAERLSRLRQRGEAVFSRAELADLVTALAADDISLERLRNPD